MSSTCGGLFPGSTMFDWVKISRQTAEENALSTLPSSSWILLEIVGAMGLKPGTVDPYCLVKVKGKEIHRTKTIYNDANPIWTVKTEAFCLVDVPVEMQNGDGIAVSVMDRSTSFGEIQIPFEKLLQGMGDRCEYPFGSSKTAKLALRYRVATLNDLQFLGKVPTAQVSDLAVASDINFKSIKPKSFFQQYRKVVKGKELVRVMPYPDPLRPKETEWMTRDDMLAESSKSSHRWVCTGDGSIGRIFLEILHCDGLPKMDINLNDYTDAFVGIAFEDSMVRTDVLWDDLNPIWMPWTNRAFEFRAKHPASILMIGVFDYDEVPVDFHDPIGRVVINLANFRCKTDYTLQYTLHHDPRQEDDEPRGAITIRLRIEFEDESEAMKMSFLPAPRFIINVDNEKSFQVLKYLTRGAVDMEKASVDSVKLYANELISYWKDYCFLLDVMCEIFLWRGRLTLSNSFSVWFPIHSVIMFGAAALVVERPDLVFPIGLYVIAWILLSVNYHASRHPNPWKRVKKSEEINMMALFGWSHLGPETVRSGQGIEEEKLLKKLDAAKGERISALISALLSTASKAYKVYSKTSLSSVAMTTKTNDWSILSGRLTYLHMMLRMICTYIRLGRSFVGWKTYSTDSFTTNCIMLATLWLLLPLNSLVHWSLRISVWILLGPWMKLVDIFFVHPWYETKQELLERLSTEDEYTPKLPELDSVLDSKTLVKMGHKGRIVAEDSYKLKDMREYLFGYYSETIPKADASRFPSVPLSSSTAKPATTNDIVLEYACAVTGQKLVGTMIQTRVQPHHILPDLQDDEEEKKNQ